jgi:RNA polymerase sigma-70 factor (ECF subfamily)
MEMGESKTDDILIARCRSGDKTAFDRLIKLHAKGLYQYILFMTKSQSLADDIYQETWTRVYNHFEDYREQGQFKCWLFKIANNQCLNHLRLFKRIFIPLTEFINIENESGIAIRIGDSDPMPDETLERKESIDLINESIKNLPIKQRQVFLLKMEGDLTFKEIAQMLNRPLNTVLTQMRTALVTIRKNLKEIYDEM